MISRYRIRKQPILIIYASVTGNAASYAYDLGAILSSSCNVNFFDACGVNASKDGKVLSLIETSTLTIFVSSTQGNGELPSLARKFFTFLFYDNGHVLSGKQVAVLGKLLGVDTICVSYMNILSTLSSCLMFQASVRLRILSFVVEPPKSRDSYLQAELKRLFLEGNVMQSR